MSEAIKTGKITKNIIDAYIKLRDKVDISPFNRFNVVIIMHPKTFLEFRNELPYGCRVDNDIECYFVYIFGRETPVLIDIELPEEINFQIMTQQDYERIEKEKRLYIELLVRATHFDYLLNYIQQKENIIKEVREYIEENMSYNTGVEIQYIPSGEDLLEILDKE